MTDRLPSFVDRVHNVVSRVNLLPGKDVPLGTIGAVVVVYQVKPGVYEVEFSSPYRSGNSAIATACAKHKIREDEQGIHHKRIK